MYPPRLTARAHAMQSMESMQSMQSRLINPRFGAAHARRSRASKPPRLSAVPPRRQRRD